MMMFMNRWQLMANMQLKNFTIAATRVGCIDASHRASGWAISYQSDHVQVVCINRSNAVRSWRNADTLIRNLRKAGYRGRLVFPVDAQQELITHD